ncbi:glycosyltransferase family 2 protein [Sinimarinibacterium sp. NLF-5-8]|uniref:glycosyltransferase family 2 protein n=1 Tax=Sinimarinibacterium sp. NLF-5-8 TaxID=2698684 RepID=UPI00137BBFA7|nr:glycosyltransferase family 2 protein [Sinimarinibacterium sp. NLF-5-8]QHS08933.1 glycosyltransferase family 2 protein [Sinimarinibacterium sp. NLF-5-8]
MSAARAPLRLALVLPCYNEEAVLAETIARLQSVMARLHAQGQISADSRMYFVDDGSRDRTWPLIAQASREQPWVAGIKLSRNRGHQNALMAGLFTVPGDAVISLDADLQDDPDAIFAMVDAHLNGADVVYGVRHRRDTDTAFKRITARAFYRLMQALDVQLVSGHADYRLLSRRALECLKDYREVNLVLRGIVPMIGLPSARVYYDRAERFAGESKYPLRKMLSLAWDSITSFSRFPLRVISVMGFVIFMLSVLSSLRIVYVALFTDDAVPGWASTVLPMYLLGGIQLLSLGVIGEYIGKIFMEVKDRPRFNVEVVLDDSSRDG